jgi:hypothetical protein
MKKFGGIYLTEKESNTKSCKCPFCGKTLNLNDKLIKCDHFVWADLGVKIGTKKVKGPNTFHFVQSRIA